VKQEVEQGKPFSNNNNQTVRQGPGPVAWICRNLVTSQLHDQICKEGGSETNMEKSIRSAELRNSDRGVV
jgi:hypothetical protein